MSVFEKIEKLLEDLHNSDENKVKTESKEITKCPNCGASLKEDYCEYCGSKVKDDKENTSNNDEFNFDGFKEDLQTAANKFGKMVNKIFGTDSKVEIKDED